jgi:hypothetical protein
MLNLIALKHNLMAFGRSAERQWQSLYRIPGVRLEGDEDGWLGVLMAAARREGLLN